MPVDVIKDLGLPVGLVAIFLWFFFKQLYPDMKKSNERSDQRAADAVKALGDLQRVIGEQGAINLQILKELQQLNKESKISARKR